MIFVDSNVAIDALNPASQFHEWSQDRLSECVGEAVFNHVVVAEMAGRAESEAELARMLDVLAIDVVPLDDRMAFRAGQAFKAFIRNGGRRGAMLPDLLIGAHATTLGATVLTRDPRRFRTYFPELELITPETDHD